MSDQAKKSPTTKGNEVMRLSSCTARETCALPEDTKTDMTIKTNPPKRVHPVMKENLWALTYDHWNGECIVVPSLSAYRADVIDYAVNKLWGNPMGLPLSKRWRQIRADKGMSIIKVHVCDGWTETKKAP